MKPPKLMAHKNGKYISHKGYVLRIGNKNMYYDLIDLGLTHRKSNAMHLPIFRVSILTSFEGATLMVMAVLIFTWLKIAKQTV